MREKFDPDKTCFSRAGLKAHRTVSGSDEIEVLAGTDPDFTIRLRDEPVLAQEDKLRAAIWRSHAMVRLWQTIQALKDPKGFYVWLQLEVRADKRELHSCSGIDRTSLFAKASSNK